MKKKISFETPSVKTFNKYNKKNYFNNLFINKDKLFDSIKLIVNELGDIIWAIDRKKSLVFFPNIDKSYMDKVFEKIAEKTKIINFGIINSKEQV